MELTKSYNNIKVDAPSKERSPFRLDHDNNTSGSFGLFQPLFCKLIVPKSKTTMSIDPIVYMSPMVAPTVGRMNYETYSAFVGMSDLLPQSFGAFLTKKPYASSSGIGAQPKVPNMRLGYLCSYVLLGCRLSVYKRTSNSSNGVEKQFAPLDQNEATTLVNNLKSASFVVQSMSQNSYPDYVGCGFVASMLGSALPNVLMPFANDVNAPNTWRPDYVPPHSNILTDPVTLESADYVFERTNNNVVYAYCVRLSNYGKQFRKILLGLGYQINFNSQAAVNLLPLFAYFKAYFDSFGLTLYQSWESTTASYLLRSWDNKVFTPMTVNNGSFQVFINDLVNTYYTDAQDFISAHQRTDVVSSSEDGFINNVIWVDNGGSSVTTQDSATEPATVTLLSKGAYINRVNHTEVDAELLKRLARFTNRNTVAGQRIEELLRLGGYGDWLAKCRSYFIGKTSTPLSISRVTATSDSTNTVTGNNSVLGEFAGQGFGHDKDVADQKFTFENDEFGYWITLGAVVPKCGYCQGLDQTLRAVEPEQFYQREFDALGFEASPKSVVMGSRDWYDGDDTTDPSASAFGLVPRYSAWKTKLNVCNGDMSLRSKRNALLPYTFDKFIDADDGYVEYIDGNNVVHVVLDSSTANLPLAGNAWRYNSRFPWMASLQRIFARYNQSASVFSPAGFDFEVPQKLADFSYLYSDDDNFYFFNNFDVTMYAPMLPISESYGTLEEGSKGNASVSKS